MNLYSAANRVIWGVTSLQLDRDNCGRSNWHFCIGMWRFSFDLATALGSNFISLARIGLMAFYVGILIQHLVTLGFPGEIPEPSDNGWATCKIAPNENWTVRRTELRVYST